MLLNKAHKFDLNKINIIFSNKYKMKYENICELIESFHLRDRFHFKTIDRIIFNFKENKKENLKWKDIWLFAYF